ncbi:MAG: UvrB/UvrC motif-containing protein [Candidatus Saccharimonas sp.]
MNSALETKLKSLPVSPGVYFHKSASGEVIYVGKAAVLRNRVRQYFQSKKDFDIKTMALVAEIADTDWVETESEIDALFLESEMVKRYMPRFNILLRDDKSQLFVRIDMKSEWPTVTFTRNPADDKAMYIGPFYNGYAVKKALRYLRKVFPYYIKEPRRDRNDLEAQIGLVPSLDTTSQEYKNSLKKLIKYVEGGRVTITNELERDMKRAARAQEFETAAKLRNKLLYLKELQRRIMFGDKEFQDISKDQALTQLTQLLGLERAPVRIEGYDVSHIGGSNVVASMVVFTNGVSDRTAYRKFKLSKQRNDDVANMREIISRRFSEKNLRDWGRPDLVLIDGGQGQLAAGIAAVELAGAFVPIVSVAKRQDELIVSRAGSHVNDTFLRELLVSSTPGVSAYETSGFYIVNLHADRMNASGHSRNLRGGDSVSPYDDLVKLVQRIRDESHRFAMSYHTVLRQKTVTRSALDDISGVGPVTRKKLIRHFGSVRGVMAASKTALADVVGPVLAAKIHAQLATK